MDNSIMDTNTMDTNIMDTSIMDTIIMDTNNMDINTMDTNVAHSESFSESFVLRVTRIERLYFPGKRGGDLTKVGRDVNYDRASRETDAANKR